jgi:hypothetical protein
MTIGAIGEAFEAAAYASALNMQDSLSAVAAFSESETTMLPTFAPDGSKASGDSLDLH